MQMHAYLMRQYLTTSPTPCPPEELITTVQRPCSAHYSLMHVTDLNLGISGDLLRLYRNPEGNYTEENQTRITTQRPTTILITTNTTGKHNTTLLPEASMTQVPTGILRRTTLHTTQVTGRTTRMTSTIRETTKLPITRIGEGPHEFHQPYLYGTAVLRQTQPAIVCRYDDKMNEL